MYPYYYIRNRKTGEAYPCKNKLEAKAKAEQLSKEHVGKQIEILMCIGMASTAAPMTHSFFFDGFIEPREKKEAVEHKKPDEAKSPIYQGFPDGMQLPKIPSGYTMALYRGLGWVTPSMATKYAFTPRHEIAWRYASGMAMGTLAFHYCEFIK
jgi:hypothetical protein